MKTTPKYATMEDAKQVLIDILKTSGPESIGFCPLIVRPCNPACVCYNPASAAALYQGYDIKPKEQRYVIRDPTCDVVNTLSAIQYGRDN